MNLDRLREINEQQAKDAESKRRHDELLLDNTRTQEIIVKAIQSLVHFLDNKVTKTELVNQLKEIGTPDVEKVVTAVGELHETLKTHKNTDLSEVTNLLKQLIKEAEQIPKSHKDIEIPKQIDNTKQIEQLTKVVVSVVEAVKAQKLNVEAPIVNVPTPEVHVDAPDLKPLVTSISTGSRDVVKAVKGIKLPELKTDSLEKLLKESNKHLKAITEKRFGGGGGGGGRVSPYQDANDVPAFVELVNGSIPVTLKNQSVIKFAPISVSTMGDNEIVASVTGKKIKLLSATLVSGGTVSVKWRSGTTDLSGAMPLVANAGFVLPASSPGQGQYFETAVTNALNINLSGAVAVYGHISYYEE